MYKYICDTNFNYVQKVFFQTYNYVFMCCIKTVLEVRYSFENINGNILS